MFQNESFRTEQVELWNSLSILVNCWSFLNCDPMLTTTIVSSYFFNSDKYKPFVFPRMNKTKDSLHSEFFLENSSLIPTETRSKFTASSSALTQCCIMTSLEGTIHSHKGIGLDLPLFPVEVLSVSSAHRPFCFCWVCNSYSFQITYLLNAIGWM